MPVESKVLNPPYSDLALGKTITTTATCGDQGEIETYCKLTGANKGDDVRINRFVSTGRMLEGMNGGGRDEGRNDAGRGESCDGS